MSEHNKKKMSSDVLFCPTDNSNPKDIQFTIMYDTEKHQILKFEKLKQGTVLAWKSTLI